MPEPTPIEMLFSKKFEEFQALARDALSDEVPVDEKIKKLYEFVGETFNEKDDERVDLLDLNYAREQFRKMWPLDLYFRPDLYGAENFPEKGGAVVVSNHVILAMDTMLLSKALFEKTGRLLRPTVDKVMIRLPYFRDWAFKMGCVCGSRENALKIVQSGEPLLAYPGGAREALKNTQGDAYKLLWDGATGFVKVAIRTQVPIIPIASVGGDESFATLSEDNGWLRRMVGKIKYTMPLYWGVGPFPLPVKFLFAVGKPIHPNLPPEAADDQGAVKEIQQRVRRELEALLDETRLKRGASPFG
ncbi:MAG: lysophospholipid acyltransferase family protein [Bdellovibrionota bacterium]